MRRASLRLHYIIGRYIVSLVYAKGVRIGVIYVRDSMRSPDTSCVYVFVVFLFFSLLFFSVLFSDSTLFFKPLLTVMKSLVVRVARNFTTKNKTSDRNPRTLRTHQVHDKRFEITHYYLIKRRVACILLINKEITLSLLLSRWQYCEIKLCL